MRELNERQTAVLNWVADGCPPREWPDYTYRNTARALQARGLVKVRGRGPTWSVEITDLGRALLARGGQTPNGAAASPQSAKRSAAGHGRVHSVLVTGQEIAQRLLDSGGVIRVVDPSDDLRASYRRALAAVPQTALPDGKRIKFTGRDRGDLVITLVDRPDASALPAPLPLPAALEAPHESMTHLIGHPELLAVSEECRDRALRILQALTAEAARRGYGVTHRGEKPGINLDIRGVQIALLLSEEQQKAIRVSDEDRARLRYEWQRATPTPIDEWNGRLAIVLARGHDRRPSWADRKRWMLEDKLALVLAAAEQWAEETIAARERDAKTRADRRRQWEEALPKARRAYLDQVNRDRLERQLETFEKAQRLRIYADAAVTHGAATSSGDGHDQVLIWAAWIRAEADRLDPTRRPDDLAYLTPDSLPAYEVNKYMPRGMNAQHPPN